MRNTVRGEFADVMPKEETLPKTHELANEATGPLKGVRILDMTSVVFGAYATQMLGDLGADVIKIEFPGGRRGGGGDIMRWAGHPPEGAPEDLGPIFMTINRNKRSVLLDLKEPAAAEALRQAQPEMQRGVGKGVSHLNTVSRKLSRLSKRIKALAAN